MASFAGVKQCARCAKSKPASGFSKTKRQKDGHQAWCKSCESAYKKDYYQKNGAKVRASRRAYRQEHGLRIDLQRLYKITPTQYHAMLANQGGVCAICGTNGKRRLAVDHDHATGKIRALLCSNCNVGIGQFKEDPARLLRAIDYLRGSL